MPKPQVHATLSSAEQYINSHTPTHTHDMGERFILQKPEAAIRVGKTHKGTLFTFKK